MYIVESARDPVFGNLEGTDIILIVKFDNFDDEIPFGASPNDPMEHGRLIYANAMNGDYGSIAPFIPPTE